MYVVLFDYLPVKQAINNQKENLGHFVFCILMVWNMAQGRESLNNWIIKECNNETTGMKLMNPKKWNYNLLHWKIN